MIWRDDDKRDELQKKLEYARELEQQIELRKALEREEKEQEEEWERRFVLPRDAASPAKWWTELRSNETPVRRDSARLGFQMDVSALPFANPAMDNGAASATSVTGSRQRFHATLGDPLASYDRLREKAQQIEWKRILDEQLRDKERRQQQEADEKRLREREEAEEDMRLQREGQLRAQRRLGITEFAPQNYVAIPSPPAPPKHGDRRASEDLYGAGFGVYEPREDPFVHPPPAPTQSQVNDGVDFNFRHAMGLTTAPPALHETGRSDSVAHEYRALLVEIRREREELRREREELRRGKEEMRMERVLMQMENEKMATLLESQRHMTDQRLESIARLDRALEAHATAPLAAMEPAPPTPHYARQTRTPRPTRLPSPLHVVHREHHVQQLKNSIASVAVGGRGPQPSPTNIRRESRLGAMSMADFAPPTTNLRSPPTRARDALHARRHERFRLREQENPLERSLHGESEFVALSPRANDARHYGTAPRITETRSPVASMMDQRANPLRSSRVIKSRGFYDIQRDDALPAPRRQQQQQQAPRSLADQHSPLRTQTDRRAARSTVSSDEESEGREQDAIHRHRRGLQPSDESDEDDDRAFEDTEQYHHEDNEHDLDADDADENDDDVANASYSESELSRSLFQVQVLVNE